MYDIYLTLTERWPTQ